MRLPGGEVRRGPDGPGTSPQPSPSKAACTSVGLCPSKPQTLPQGVCRYADQFELHGGVEIVWEMIRGINSDRNGRSPRRGPGGPGAGPQLSPSKATYASVGLRPSTLQTVPRTVCPCGSPSELHSRGFHFAISPRFHDLNKILTFSSCSERQGAG